MPLAAILESLVIALAEAGLSKLAPVILQKLGSGVASTIAKDALASPLVQEWLTKAETAAAEELAKLAGEAIAALKAFFESHVSKSIVSAVESAIPADFVLHLTAKDVKIFAADIVGGKWAQVEAFAEQAVGLAP